METLWLNGLAFTNHQIGLSNVHEYKNQNFIQACLKGYKIKLLANEYIVLACLCQIKVDDINSNMVS